MPVADAENAREIVKTTKCEFSDATHVVHAFIAGLHSEISGCSDDGEPPGTAGKPVLDILKGNDLSNCLLIVIRYFGGTKLGTGGLVKAYSDIAKEVIRNATVKPLVEMLSLQFNLHYEIFDKVKQILLDHHIEDLETVFGSGISVTGSIPKTAFDSCSRELADISRGQIQITAVDLL